MKKSRGWLFDLYAHPERGIILWLVGEDEKPCSFHQDFEIQFYARESFPRLHELGEYLRRKHSKEAVRLERVTRGDLFDGPQEVIRIGVSSPMLYKKLFQEVHENFSDLIFYDVDIPLTARSAATCDVFMIADCEVAAEPDGRLVSIHRLDADTPDGLKPMPLHLRFMSLRPDSAPSHKPPQYLIVKFGISYLRLPFNRPRELLRLLNSPLSSFDPDVIQTHFGDAWLFPHLQGLSKINGIAFHPNRDSSLPVLRRKEVSFINYGHAHYRAPQIHLRGRWHVDVDTL